MTVTEWAFVALGSNMGDRESYLRLGRDSLKQLPETTLAHMTGVEETPPLGTVPQGPFLNQMVLLQTALPPRVLLQQCQAIENLAGRVRNQRWGPRSLDIDIVRYGDRVIAEDDLVIPHPEIANRAFWQRELAELETHARRE